MMNSIRSHDRAHAEVTLLALWGAELPTATLRRAARMAASFGHDLHVHRVLPPVLGVNALFPQRNMDDVFRAMSAAEHSFRVTRSWLTETLDDEGPGRHLTTSRGTFAADVVAKAKTSGTGLVVVSPAAGKVASEIACESGVPVLVPRKMGREDTIVAATNLETEGNPVLVRAANLGAATDAPVVAIHNLGPLGGTLSWPLWSLAATVERLLFGAHGKLQRAAARLPLPARAVLTVGADVAKAVLSEARLRDADLVVVGARHKSWLERWASAGVTDRIVADARRSVWLEPIT